MKKLLVCLTALVAIIGMDLCQAKTIDEYVTEAAKYQESGQLDQAITIMEQAVEEYPDNSDAYTQLGIYISNKAQKTKEYGEIMKGIERAFLMWDKAVILDPNNFTARFHRGAWGVNMPKFTGTLEKGIKDLEFLVMVFEQSPDPAAKEQLVGAYHYLATGYQKQGAFQKAKQMHEKVIAMVPDTEYADKAKNNINSIVLYEKWQLEREKTKKPDSPRIIELKEEVEMAPDNADLLIALGNAYIDVENFEQAERVLKQAIELAPSNVGAYKLLALVLGQISSEDYDPRISMDSDFRTNLAFEVMQVFDKIVSLAPEDIEMRFHRGVMGVEMPFFVGKLDQAIDDLKMVIENGVSDSTKAKALYWLGRAHQKKAMTYWINVVSEYSYTEAAKFVFDGLNPAVKRIDLSQYKKPIVVIDFVLGFRDELAPQTAVWVEDRDGNFVKTVYVSGFSGYAKEKQVNLPVWAKASSFVDVDGVTGASIDLGHHIYVWNLRDNSGKKVKSGEYIVKVETAYWPSMQYQRVSAPVKIGRKEEHTVVEEGNLIPYLEIEYIP